MAKDNSQNHHQKEGFYDEKQQNGKDKKTGSSPKFVSRVSSIPVVQDSLSTAHEYANKTSLGRFALSTANYTLNTVSKYTNNRPEYVQTYYESYIQPHVETVDAFGCRSLDMIQTRFPVVTHPTEDIVKAVTVPSYQVVDGVKTRIDTTFTQPAHQVAQQANRRFGTVVNNVESVLNRYLPPADEKKREVSQEQLNDNQVLRAYLLAQDLSDRLTVRIQEQVKSTTARIPSRSDVAHLVETSEIVQKASENLQALQQMLPALAENHLPPALFERFQTLQAGTQEKLQAITGLLTAQAQQTVNYFKSQSAQTSEWFTASANSLVDIANKQVELVRAEYERKDISSLDKAKNVAQNLQSQVLPLFETIQAQLTHFAHLARQKASNDLNGSLDYHNHAPQVAQAQ